MKTFQLCLFTISLFILAAFSMSAQIKPPEKTEEDSLKIRSDILADTSVVFDSTQSVTAPDTMKPIINPGFISSDISSYRIKKNDIQLNDYRTISNLITLLPFGYVQDLGWLGQPNEVLIAGNGYNNLSVVENGVVLNNRISNSYEFNRYQSESLDSIYLVPLTQSFLYGNNNQSTVLLYPKIGINTPPYSRLRFHQAPEGEGFVDVLFNALFTSKLNIGFELTNFTVDPRYANSGASHWIGSASMRYMFSNKFNLIAKYKFVDSYTELNGGVDYNFLINNFSEADADEIMYNNFQAPVLYGELNFDSPRYKKVSSNQLRLDLLLQLVDNAFSTLTVYYVDELEEFRQNEKETYSDIPKIINDNSYSLYGGSFHQNYSGSFFQADILANLEVLDSKAQYLYYSNKELWSYSFAGKLKLFPFDFGYTSVFGKYLTYNEKSFSGAGIDAALNITKQFQIYSGYSYYTKPYNLIEIEFGNPKNNSGVSTFHTMLSFSAGTAKLSAGYFRTETNNASFAVIEQSYEMKVSEVSDLFFEDTKNEGFNLSVDYEISNVLIKTNLAYYFTKTSDIENLLPEFTGWGGIYYVDTLFNNNLKLKAGINYKFSGVQNHLLYDFEKSIPVYHHWNNTTNEIELISPLRTNSSFQIDLFVAGRIQEAAIFYFVFENILDRKYYIVPYYPMQARGIRFGLSWEFLD
ncbi:MAG: hypothetical protein PHW27_07700 [Melioribacteraceae bacterium]|nr:hypothetical protein [Melioribacteraceae bacterium]